MLTAISHLFFNKKTKLFLFLVRCMFISMKNSEIAVFIESCRENKLYMALSNQLDYSSNMDNILSVIKDACREIIENEQSCFASQNEQTQQQSNLNKSDQECQDQGKCAKQDTSQRHNIVVIQQQQSNEHQPIPQPSYQPKYEKMKQAEVSEPKSALKVVFKTNPSKSKSKSSIQSARKAQMNKQVLSKVNISELKGKLNLNTKVQTTTDVKINIPTQSVGSKPLRNEQPLKNGSIHIQFNHTKPSSVNLPPNSQLLNELAARGKVAKKGGKSDRPTKPTNPTINSNISRFLQRRNRKQGDLIDLGVLSLDQLVGHCHLKKIITEEFYVEYIANSNQDNITQFINLFIKNQLKYWDFTRIKITIMDHRRLAQYLARIFPSQYKICTPDALNSNVKEFLDNLYVLPSIKYKKLLDSLDAQSKVVEWKTLSIRYQKYANIPIKIHPVQTNTALQVNSKKSGSGGDSRFVEAKPSKAASKLNSQGKRSLNLLYNEDSYQYLQFQDDNDKKINALKHQLKKKKVA